MQLRELLEALKKIQGCHPDAGDAQVWAVNLEGEQIRIDYVGFDKKHKPARIKLEE